MDDQFHKQIAETKILQKVNAAHRGAFTEKFPGQLEHCLRLVMERLHAGLDKRDGVYLTDVSSWKLTPGEIADLAEAVHYLNEVRKGL
jgi:hypothetical protein